MILIIPLRFSFSNRDCAQEDDFFNLPVGNTVETNDSVVVLVRHWPVDKNSTLVTRTGTKVSNGLESERV